MRKNRSKIFLNYLKCKLHSPSMKFSLSSTTNTTFTFSNKKNSRFEVFVYDCFYFQSIKLQFKLSNDLYMCFFHSTHKLHKKRRTERK